MIHLRVENSSTVRQWTLLRSLVSPPHSASHHANAVARVHASLDGRLCRIIRGGCVCHEVEGRRVHRWCRVSPVSPIFPVIRNARLLSHRTYRGRRGDDTRRREASTRAARRRGGTRGVVEGAERRSLD